MAHTSPVAGAGSASRLCAALIHPATWPLSSATHVSEWRSSRFRRQVFSRSLYLASSTACAWARSDGMTEIRARRAGLVRLRVRVGLGTALATVAGGSSGCQPMQH